MPWPARTPSGSSPTATGWTCCRPSRAAEPADPSAPGPLSPGSDSVRPRHGERRALDRAEAPAQRAHTDPLRGEAALGAPRTGPGRAVQHGALETLRGLGPGLGAGEQLPHRQVLGAADHPARELVLLADVDHPHARL